MLVTFLMTARIVFSFHNFKGFLLLSLYIIIFLIFFIFTTMCVPDQSVRCVNTKQKQKTNSL